MARNRTAEDEGYDVTGGDVAEAAEVMETSDTSTVEIQVPRPDPAAASGVVIETKVTVTAPSLSHLASYIDGVAEVIEAETGGQVSGRSTKAKQEAVGKAKGLREAAALVRAAKLTGG